MPAQPLGWFRKEITGVGDMKGLKYRTVGLAANVMQEMGMSVVQLPGGEIQPAMERGLIDAAEFNNPTSDKDFGMQDVAKHYYLASFHQSQETFEIIFNKKKYRVSFQGTSGHTALCLGSGICRHVLEGPGSLLQRLAGAEERAWRHGSPYVEGDHEGAARMPGTRCCRNSWRMRTLPRSWIRRRPG